MHHKLIGGDLDSGYQYSQNGRRRRIQPVSSNRMLGGFGNYYESGTDDEDERNMTHVGYDHIPLTPGLSHAVRLELGTDPMVLGPERKISDADCDSEDDDSASRSSSSESSAPSTGLRNRDDDDDDDDDEPMEIRPLYKEEPTTTITEDQATPNLFFQQTKKAPTMLYNTTRSKDVLQLKLAMQKQTEFDDLYRDMDHRDHCFSTPAKASIPTFEPTPPTTTTIPTTTNRTTIPNRKRSRSNSRSNSPVPQFIAVSPEVLGATEPARRLKSPPPGASPSVAGGGGGGVATATAAAAASATSAANTPNTSSVLLKSTYVRRPHKNKRKSKSEMATTTSTASAGKLEKQTSTKKKASPPNKKPSPPKQQQPQEQQQQHQLEDSEEDSRFKRFQNTQWNKKFQELLIFRKENGHCQVPHTWPPNPQLARWVKRQRYQFKLRCEGKLSTMTEDRISLLDDAGFVWDSHAAAWQEKYEELKDYVKKNKTFNMGSSYSTHPQLATWVKCQRRQYKLLMAGEESNMTHERKDLLEKLGFLWDVRKSGHSGTPKNK
ncbi:unnamed protein product [Cylindrotheca closterium]|uniref:Helicase-associated domain-containing protein n=1 Tax=Cylindrotheca closterium TaxID=2856 RepID=A0AAD2JGW7_9STRA|nr:unnamed protein product [Cylindrotheca closterium]